MPIAFLGARDIMKYCTGTVELKILNKDCVQATTSVQIAAKSNRLVQSATFCALGRTTEEAEHRLATLVTKFVKDVEEM